ncbi:MAG: CHASE2 domain-containing protein [Rhodobacterales bacterium]|nr:CHASE2 domain-containing protein [Rhodobacterales bacterium]
MSDTPPSDETAEPPPGDGGAPESESAPPAPPSEPEPARVLSPFLMFWVRVIGYGIFGVAMLFLDPFGVGDATDEYSDQLFKIVASPLWSKREKNVTVVLVSDSTLRSMETTWPLSYGDQTKLITRILRLGPTALFVDLVFIDRRENSGSLKTMEMMLDHHAGKAPPPPESCREKGDRIPIFWASGRLDSHYPLLDELLKVGEKVVTAWERQPGYPLVWFADKKTNAIPPHIPIGKSAALALFESQCASKCAPEGCPCRFQPQAFAEPMAIQWDSTVDDRQIDWSDSTKDGAKKACLTYGDGAVSRWLTVASRALKVLFFGRNLEDELAQRCLPVLTVPAEFLLNDANYFDANRADAFKAAFQDRLVIYGPNLASIQDHYPSPVHGLVPGAVVHAMALENLIQKGEAYIRFPRSGEGGESWAVEAVEAGLYVLLILMASLFHLATDLWHDPARRALLPRFVPPVWRLWGGSGIWIYLMSLTTVMLVCGYLALSRHWAAINWLGLFGLVLAGNLMISHEVLVHFVPLVERAWSWIRNRVWPCLARWWRRICPPS